MGADGIEDQVEAEGGGEGVGVGELGLERGGGVVDGLKREESRKMSVRTSMEGEVRCERERGKRTHLISPEGEASLTRGGRAGNDNVGTESLSDLDGEPSDGGPSS